MLKVYLVAGVDLHKSISTVLEENGYILVGYEYTLDAAVIALKNKPENADLFIINGLAQASGISENEINRSRSMLIKLREIRMLTPQSRILLLLPQKNPVELIVSVLSLGIYDIRQVSRFNGKTLIEWISRPMTIADFQELKIGKIPDYIKGDVQYEKGLEDNIQRLHREKVGETADILVKEIDSLQDKKNVDVKSNIQGRETVALLKIKRKRKGKPAAIICVGDRRIEEWIDSMYTDRLDVLLVTSDAQEAKEKTEELKPDILMLMYQNNMGGVPDADSVAVWAIDKVSAVLYIIGRLDEKGLEQEKIATEAGIQHIFTCGLGGYISGDELAYTMEQVIRELENCSEEGGYIGSAGRDFNLKGSFGALTKGMGSLGKAIFSGDESDDEPKKEKEVKKKAKKVKPKINKKEGLSLSEDDDIPLMSNIKNPTSIVPGGILAIVSPWRPSLSGRLAAQAVRILGEVENSMVAYIGASKDSTGGMWLDLTAEELMMSDWRVPGSNAPIKVENKIIYATDPSKDLAISGGDLGLPEIIRDSRKTATYTVMDFAGDISAINHIAHQGRAVILVIVPTEDPVEFQTSSLWLRLFMEGKQNIVVGMDIRSGIGNMQCELKPKILIQGNPADAMASALRQVGEDEFVWN